jgi:methionine synthase I (cobalamin-dependent)
VQANELFTQPNTILLDGGMGTMLQAAGLKLGARPEELNITDPQLIESIHSRYAAAGSRIINANTFGASAHKLAGSEYTLEEIIAAGIANCKRACAPYGALAALDVGPLGELLEPNGTLAFEDAVAEYGRIVRAGVAAGADLVFFETFTDLYELKAALLAAKENCGLPILASMSFEAGAPSPAAPSRASPSRPGASGPTPWASTAPSARKKFSPWRSGWPRPCPAISRSLSSRMRACPGPTAAATTSRPSSLPWR